MKQWFLIFLSITLLVVACKHKNEKQAIDSVPKNTDTAIAVDNTIVPAVADTITHMKEENTLNIHEDSIEITNLRLLARKQKVIYSSTLLIGEWIHGTEHEEYYANGTGRMWDTSDDVSSDEAQRFEWTLDSNLLTIICHLELGAILPKRYIVTFADDETLAYKDLYGSAYLWDKR